MNIVLRELRPTVAFAAKITAATLGELVVYVFLRCAGEEMIRPDTWRIVAFVERPLSVNERAPDGALQRKSVRGLRTTIDAKATIPRLVADGGPWPATIGIRSIDMQVESTCLVSDAEAAAGLDKDVVVVKPERIRNLTIGRERVGREVGNGSDHLVGDLAGGGDLVRPSWHL